MFDEATARDLRDAIGLLEAKCRGTTRRLAMGTLLIRRVVEVTKPDIAGHRARGGADGSQDDAVVELLTLADVAERVRRDVRTVRRWVAAGQLRVVYLGAAARVRPEDLQAFIDALPTQRETAA